MVAQDQRGVDSNHTVTNTQHDTKQTGKANMTGNGSPGRLTRHGHTVDKEGPRQHWHHYMLEGPALPESCQPFPGVQVHSVHHCLSAVVSCRRKGLLQSTCHCFSVSVIAAACRVGKSTISKLQTRRQQVFATVADSRN